MLARQRWTVGYVAAVAVLVLGTVGCGDSGSSSKPAVTTAAETAGVAGSWGGTWTEGAENAVFAAEIDCAGIFTGTLTPTGSDAEQVTGTVTTWNATTGAFQATVTRSGESHTLTGVVNGSDLTGSFTTDTGATGNFVVTLSGDTTICTVQQIADLTSGSSVSADLVTAVNDANTTCNGTGADPYRNDSVAILLKPNAGGTVDVIMSFAPTETTAQVGLIGSSADTASDLRLTGVGTTSGTDYLATLDITLAIAADGTLTGTFTGNVDANGDGDLTGANDCSAITGTLSGSPLVR